MQTSDPFSPHIEAVARAAWGDPNQRLSSKQELRWGTHGSRSVDLEKGVWFDHEADEGGGVLDFLKREHGLINGVALDYLRENFGAEVGTPLGTGAIARAFRQAATTPRRPDPEPQVDAPPSARSRVVATYDYTDEAGELLFQVVRLDPKDFRQRRRATADDPPGKVRDGWVWGVRGVRQTPYRLPALLALESAGPVFVVEGEKDVDRLEAMGLTAVCNAGGAGKWTDEHAGHLRGCDVILLPDNDEAGRSHCAQVGASLKGVARTVAVLDLPDLPIKGDVSDWIDAGGDREALLELVETSSRAWAPQPPTTKFGAVLWRDIASIKPRTDHLVEDLMFRGDLGLCYGESRAGKSFVKLDLSLSIARGVPFFGMKTMQAPVAYQAGEGALGAVSRLQAYGLENRVATADLPFVLLKSRVNLFARDGDVDAFIAELLAWQDWLGRPFGLVTIDTFSAATPGANENASEDVSIVLGNGHKIREATGAAVGFVHHKNAGGQKARGHTSIFADADFAIDVSRDEATNERSFKLAKVKDGEDGKEFGFYLQPVEIGTKESGKPITSCVVRPAMLIEEPGGKEGRSGSAQITNYLRTLKETLRRHGHYAAQGVPVPNRLTKVVEYELFREALKAKAEPGTSDDTFRQQIKRVGEKLLAEDRIGRHQKSEDGAAVIWITEAGEFGK